MRVIYPEYSKAAIAERRIGRTAVAAALHHPDELIASKKGRWIAQKLLGHRLLRVVHIRQQKAYIVVTAYYADPRRYSKNEHHV